MRRTFPLTLSVTAALALTAPAAQAAMPHTVEPGETLWSIAAASNLTTRTLAAYNGLPEDANVVLGTTIDVPSVAEGAAALGAAGITPASTGGTAAPGASAPPPAGAYTVKPGDTFSGLAARAGTTPAQVAGVNGLSLDRPLLAGTSIKLPPAAVAAATGSTGGTAGPATTVPKAAPAATGTRVDASTVTSVAGQHGVPGSLAAAIAWQESGFDNAMVSSANARGVMQVMPGTWDWVQDNLASRRLDPSSAEDNVHAGTLYLKQLLRESGGDPVTAAASYYQGPASVKKIGMLPETRRYVENVMALRSRFGG
jgi:LysM repeat protein